MRANTVYKIHFSWTSKNGQQPKKKKKKEKSEQKKYYFSRIQGSLLSLCMAQWHLDEALSFKTQENHLLA